MNAERDSMYLTDMGLINSTNGLEGKFVVFEDHVEKQIVIYQYIEK